MSRQKVSQQSIKLQSPNNQSPLSALGEKDKQADLEHIAEIESKKSNQPPPSESKRDTSEPNRADTATISNLFNNPSNEGEDLRLSPGISNKQSQEFTKTMHSNFGKSQEFKQLGDRVADL